MKIPEEVKDKAHYLKYVALSKHPILTENKVQIASDGTKVNLAAFHNVVRKWVSHLPISEQKTILDLKDEYCLINNNLTKHKRLAFGKHKPVSNDSTLLSIKHEEILALFGKFHTPEDITKIAQKDWGLPIGITAVKRYYELNKKEIEASKEQYRASYADVRLGVKRSRLEELTYLYQIQKDKYEERPSNDNYRLLLSTLEQIRKEAEGDRLTIDGKIDVNYEVNIQQHLRDEVFRTINLKEIILGRVAARMGLNPIKLIHSLNNSYYKQFSNVLGSFNEDDEGEVVYPSQLSYDFERIGKAQSALDKYAQDAVVIEEEIDDQKDFVQAKSIKEMMLEKLRAKQESLNAKTKK